MEETAAGKTFTFVYEYDYSRAPYDLLLRGTGSGTIPLTVTVHRPDGRDVEIIRYVLQDQDRDAFRLSFANEGRANAMDFIRGWELPENSAQLSTMSYGVREILFSKAEPGFVRAPSRFPAV